MTTSIEPSKKAREEMPWPEVCHFIAQGAINITEGLTAIERGSLVHRALEDFCEHETRTPRVAELSKEDWATIRRSLARDYVANHKALRRAHKRAAGAAGPRPSELAMELATIKGTYDKVIAVYPAPVAAKKSA